MNTDDDFNELRDKFEEIGDKILNLLRKTEEYEKFQLIFDDILEVLDNVEM